MTAATQRLHGAMNHPATLPLVLIMLTATSVHLDRFPHWDESVFMSQTAGRDGIETPEVHLGPSREIGSVWKLGMLTVLAANYPNLRLLHILLTIFVIAVAAAAISRTTDTPRTIVGLVLGTYWVTFAHIGQLLRFAILCFILLTALAMSAQVLTSQRPASSRLMGLAALFTLGLALGPFEAGVVLACTILYWLVGRPVWRDARPFLLLAAGTSIGALIVYMLDTVPRYGSLVGRIEAMAAIDGNMRTSTFNWALLDDYFELVVSGPVSDEQWAPQGPIAQVAYLVAAVLMLLGLYTIVRWVVRLATGRDTDHFTALCSLSFLALMMFLAGFYSKMDDRYFILPGSLLLLLGLILLRDIVPRLVARLTQDEQRRRLVHLSLAYLGLTAFIVPNVAAARELDGNWTGDSTGSATLELVRDAVRGEPCVGVARFNTPSIQWATGCDVRRTNSLKAALAAADDVEDGSLTFVYWRTRSVTPELQQELNVAGWEALLTYPDGNAPEWQVWLRTVETQG